MTIPIAFVQGMLSGVQARHGSGDTWLAQAGIGPELLHKSGARVTTDQYVALFRALVDGLDDEWLGLLSRPLRRGTLALLLRSALGSPTLDIAIHRFASIFRLLQDDVLLETVEEAGLTGARLLIVDGSRGYAVFLHELMLRVLWRVMAWLVGGTLPVSRFDFAFAPPPHAGDYGKVFPAPLAFGCRHSAIWFETVRLQDPVRRDEAALRAFLAEVQRQVIMPRRTEALLGSRVRDTLQHRLPQWSDLATVAEALHMSPSTVQRRLAVEGTSFQALKDELRRDLAIVRLNTSAVPLAALAYELGFADSPAFQRAFKGWTGSPPGAYRRGGS